MILSEQVWRIAISAVFGIAAGLIAAVLQQARREPAIPLVAALTAAATAFAIDIYTDRKAPSDR